MADIKNGLIGWWPLDKASSGSIADNTSSGFEDASGWAHNAIAKNGSTNMSWTTGKIGRGAVTFDGTDDYISAAFAGTHNTEVTLSAWINCSNTSVESRVIAYGTSTGNRASIQIDGVTAGTVRGIVGGDGGSAVRTGTEVAISSSTWTHVAMTFNGTVMTLYVNGAATSDTFAATTLGTSFQQFDIGARKQTSVASFFPGIIDDPRIYGRCLTQADITELYNWRGESQFLQFM